MSPRAATHLLRQLALAAATGTVLRPLDTPRTSVPSFAVGWLTGELAPQIVALSLADAALAVRRHRASPLSLALTAATTAGLAWSICEARRAAPALADALVDGTDTAAEPLPSTALTTLLRPFNFRDSGVRVDSNIAYGEHSRRALLDIYRPAGREVGGAPVLVQIHGGGWTIGRKEEQGRLLMNRMAAQGWVCVAINYRLSPRHRWPVHLEDVRAALAWVGEHIGEYGGDAGHVVLTGGSAGGHLAALAALTAPAGAVAGCVPFYGVYDMLGEDQDVYTVGLRETFLAPRVFATDASLDDYRDASPVHHVSAEAPDFFVLHGTHDTLVSVRQARAFVARLRSVSRRSVTYAELPLAQHAFDIFGSIRAHHAVDAVERWLLWHHTSLVEQPVSSDLPR